MNVEPQAANLDPDSISGGVRKAPEGEVAYPLDRDTGDDSKNGEEDEGGEVEEDKDTEGEGRTEKRHVCSGAQSIT